MKKVSKKYLAHKYKDKTEVNKEDVRLLLELYENKIKRLKFLLNTYKKKSEKEYHDCWFKGYCVKDYAKQLIKIYQKILNKIPDYAMEELTAHFISLDMNNLLLDFNDALKKFEDYMDKR